MQTDVNGISLHYDDAGSGTPLILIHGFPLAGAIWRQQLAGLASGCRVIVPDLRGFGGSSAPEGGYSMDVFADDLILLLNRLGIDRGVFCGMSMGGYVVLNLLERHRERVRGACFMVTRAGADDAAGKSRRTVLADTVRQQGAGPAADVFSSILFAPQTATSRPELLTEIRDLMLAAAPAGLAGGLLALRDRQDYSERLGEIFVPTLVIGAEDDRAIPPEESRLLAAGIPGARLCMVANAGHMVMLEQPEIVNRALAEFVATV